MLPGVSDGQLIISPSGSTPHLRTIKLYKLQKAEHELLLARDVSRWPRRAAPVTRRRQMAEEERRTDTTGKRRKEVGRLKKTRSADAAINNTSRLNMADETTHVFSDAPPVILHLRLTCCSTAERHITLSLPTPWYSLSHTHTPKSIFSINFSALRQVWKMSRSAADRFPINILQAIGSEHQHPKMSQNTLFLIISTVTGREVVSWRRQSPSRSQITESPTSDLWAEEDLSDLSFWASVHTL